MKSLIAFVIAAAVLFSGCRAPKPGAKAEPKPAEEPAGALTLTSSAFAEGQPIPKKHSAYAENLSPSLSWTNVPTGTKSFVLVCRDPGAPAGEFYHWGVFNIPVHVTMLAEGQPRTANLPNGALQTGNDFGRVGYDGPKPPSGEHQYFFDLYALDTTLGLDRASSAAALPRVVQGRILGQTWLMGTYKK
jgi:hypothetical protein